MATQEEAQVKKSDPKRKKLLIGLGAVAVIVAAGLIILGIGHEKTDNAQLDGNIVPVRASVAGYVTDVRFTDNQRVHQGDTLATIRTDDYAAMVAQAEAGLATAKASLEAAKTGLTMADQNAQASSLSSMASKESISTAETRLWKAQQDMARVDAMAKDNAATPQQVDAMKAEVEVAKAQVEMAKKQTDAAQAQASGSRSHAKAQEAQIALAQATVAQREAELKLAQIRLSNTVITVPFDAVISKKSVEPGQYLSVGAPICAAVNENDIWVTANFKETQLTNMRVGQPVKVKVDAFPKLNLTGHVSSLSGATGARFSLLPPDNATGNFVKVTQRLSVRIDLDSTAQDSTLLLAPGLSVTVDVKTKS
ncbi:MAG: HlyD family secretion protein [Flavobacteriales bacterium]|nr:HlyD family secretion protein [Flavobacteriales bacterium]